MKKTNNQFKKEHDTLLKKYDISLKSINDIDNERSGHSTRDIISIIKDIYGFDLQPNVISKIADKILLKIKDFKSRILEKTYAVVFIGAIKFKTRE